MTIEIALLISVVTVCTTIFFSSKREGRETRTNIEDKAKREAKMDVMLADISGDVKDIKHDVTGVKRELTAQNEKIVIMGQSLKRAHERIDEITKNIQ